MYNILYQYFRNKEKSVAMIRKRNLYGYTILFIILYKTRIKKIINIK